MRARVTARGRLTARITTVRNSAYSMWLEVIHRFINRLWIDVDNTVDKPALPAAGLVYMVVDNAV